MAGYTAKLNPALLSKIQPVGKRWSEKKKKVGRVISQQELDRIYMYKCTFINGEMLRSGITSHSLPTFLTGTLQTTPTGKS